MVDAETKLSDRIFMILAGEYCADGVLSTVMIVMHGNVMFVRRTGGERAAARFGHKEGARLLPADVWTPTYILLRRRSRQRSKLFGEATCESSRERSNAYLSQPMDFPSAPCQKEDRLG
jgi:hypothetical protein